jgi:PhnB protein
MPQHVKSVPDGYYTLTPHLAVTGASAAIEFYKRAFGAEELMRMPTPDGKVMHAELQIGNSRFMLAEEFPEWGVRSATSLGGSPVSILIYVDDADAAYDRAVKAGATPTMPLANQFWGDRYGKVKDPYGLEWAIATHIEEVSPEECVRRMAQQFGGGCKPS